MPSFTTEELLLYMYNELNTETKLAIENALNSDWALSQKYEVLQEARERLSRKKLLSPKQQSIDVIMQHAKKNVSVCN